MVAGQQTGEYFVDIVMCIDATGSMGPIIGEVKNNAIEFYQKFVDKMETKGKEISQLRIKVIAFRDFKSDEEPMKESEFFNLPEQNDEFKTFVEKIEAKGGGDEPENALEAIALALKSDWTKAGAKRRHVVLVFSDASAHDLGAEGGADSPRYPSDMPKNLGQLRAWWEGNDQTFSSKLENEAKRLIAFVPNASPWSDMENFSLFWPMYSTAGTGLSEETIDTALEILAGSV